MTDALIAALVKRVKRRWTAGADESDDRSTTVKKEAEQLRRECDRLAEAIAKTDVSVTALVEKLTARQQRLAKIEAQLAAAESAPKTFSLEVRRLEHDAKKRIADLRGAFERDSDGARTAMQTLVDGPLIFTPIDTIEGRRYRVEGRVTTGALLSAQSYPQWQRPQGDSKTATAI